MLDTKLNKIIKKKSKTINRGKYVNKRLKEKRKKNKNMRNKYYQGGGKIVNINKNVNCINKRTKKLKNTRKRSRNNSSNKISKKRFKQNGGTTSTTTTTSTPTTYNRNVEPTTPLRDYLRFGDQLDQNVERMDLGPKWPGKPPYPPDCCIM